MRGFRLSLGELMVLVAILAFDAALVREGVRAGWSRGRPGTFLQTFAYVAGVLSFGPLAALNTLALRQPNLADRRNLILALPMTWPPFLLCAAGFLHLLFYGR